RVDALPLTAVDSAAAWSVGCARVISADMGHSCADHGTGLYDPLPDKERITASSDTQPAPAVRVGRAGKPHPLLRSRSDATGAEANGRLGRVTSSAASSVLPGRPPWPGFVFFSAISAPWDALCRPPVVHFV